MSSTTLRNGRLGNIIIRNLAVSLIAQKHNLFVDYAANNLIEQLGIKLFCGEKKHNNIITLNEDNYFSILSQENLLESNIDPNQSYFQTKEITNIIYNMIHNNLKENIIKNNMLNYRYNNNNDLFIHIRLTDVSHHNPGLEYYIKAISNINFDNIYIASDDLNHIIIKKIIEKYPNTKLVNYNEIDTINFGSTCKNIILSHGSFSAIIGYLAFFSTIYYPEYETNKMWYGDMFSIEGWNKLCVK